MTKEDIEKAAVDSCVIENDIFNPQLTPYYEQGFKDGANWRINSVWHDASVNPDTDKGDLLLIIKDGFGKNVYVRQDAYYVRKYGCVRWAYIEDLIPNNEN